MKSLLPLLLLTSLLLSGCSVGSNDDFEKQLTCKNISLEKINTQLQESSNSNLEVLEIFYSPSIDSCLYTAINRQTKGEFEFSPEGTLYLFDYNKNQNISVGMPVKEQEFNQKIKDLKGE